MLAEKSVLVFSMKFCKQQKLDGNLQNDCGITLRLFLVSNNMLNEIQL